MRPPGSTPPALPTLNTAASFRPDGGRVQALLAELMSTRKELTETSTELRKVTNERNALRIRLAHAENSARELASASRAEAELRSEFVDTHAATSAALRARVGELEAALAEARRAAPHGEQQGLRQIRGIGPAFERALLGLGITTVSQIAALDAGEIERIAPLIKARSERILRDEWVGQAKRLLGA
jgi:predicted flap endonuclease-1-like 5' DNA nuclease